MTNKKELTYEVSGSGCHLVTSHRKKENGYIQIYSNGRLEYVHREAYRKAIGPIPDGMIILHTCDVRHCINPDHLKAGTIQENNQDRQNKNRQAKGSKMNTAVLTEMEVLQLSGLLGSISSKELASMYNISVSMVGYIRRGDCWSHVTGIKKSEGGRKL